MEYTVFIIDGSFVDIEDVRTDCVRFDSVGEEDMQTMMRLAVASGYDVVVREYGE